MIKKHLKKIVSLIISKKHDLPIPWKFSPPPGIRFVDVRNLDELANHAAAWNELFAKSVQISPQLSYQWLSPFFKHKVTSPEQWLCLFAYRNEQLVGVMPLVAGYSMGFAGAGMKLFKLPYHIISTSGVDCLVLPGEESIIGTFFDYLKKNPCGYPVLSFKFIPGHYPSAKYFTGGRSGLQVIQRPAGFENFIPLPENLESYIATFSSNFKKYLKKNSKKLAELPEVKFTFADTSHNTEENCVRFMDVEHSNWKGERQSSLKADPGDAGLFTDAAIGFAQLNMMNFNFIETEGKAIAGQYSIRAGKTLYIPKIGYNQEYIACSPGNLLFNHLIEHHIESKEVDRINLMADCAWHESWKPEKIQLYHLIVLPNIPILSTILALAIKSGRFHEFKSTR